MGDEYPDDNIRDTVRLRLYCSTHLAADPFPGGIYPTSRAHYRRSDSGISCGHPGPGCPEILCRFEPEISALIAAAVILLGGYFSVILPALEIYRTERSYAGELREKTAGISADRIAFYPDIRSNMIFYLGKGTPVKVFKENRLGELKEFLFGSAPRVIIAKSKYRNVILPLFPPGAEPTGIVTEKVHPWEKKKAGKRRIAWFFGLYE